VTTAILNVSWRESVQAVIETAKEIGAVRGVIERIHRSLSAQP
jgi:hypothetical protein